MARRPVPSWTVLFFLALVAALVAVNLARPRLLVLHSFAESDPWVQGVNQGISAGLATNRRPLLLETYMMNSELISRPEVRRQTRAAARRAIERFRPDLILAVDDEASTFLASLDDLPRHTRILAVSLLQPPHDLFRRWSGPLAVIRERLPLEPLRTLLEQLHPGRPLRLAALGVASETGQAELAQVRGFDWGPHRLVSSRLVHDVPSWQRAVRALRGQADVLLVISDFGLTADPTDPGRRPGRPTPLAIDHLIARWTETHADPLPIGLHVGYSADGGGLSLFPAPEVYGKAAISDALAWLDQRDGSAAPASRRLDHFDVALRASAIQRRRLQLPSIYIEAARAAGRFYP